MCIFNETSVSLTDQIAFLYHGKLPNRDDVIIDLMTFIIEPLTVYHVTYRFGYGFVFAYKGLAELSSTPNLLSILCQWYLFWASLIINNHSMIFDWPNTPLHYNYKPRTYIYIYMYMSINTIDSAFYRILTQSNTVFQGVPVKHGEC